jgi:hypothetical protein
MRKVLCALLPLALAACAGGEGADSTACIDGLDNDDNGKTDCEDATCADYDFCIDGVAGPQAYLRINEFMASNSWTVEDESGAYPDWVEIYNPNDGELSLEGLRLTDDLEEPDKHILGDLIIEGGGFQLLWADSDEEDGDSHLSFRLSKSGESLGLYDADGTLIDGLNYSAQATDYSAARIPDGSDSWAISEDPTPGTSNGE